MNFIEKIRNTKAPEHWLNKETEHPNDIAKDNATKGCSFLFNTYKKIPVVIAATVASGIYVRYTSNDLDLVIEFYNDGEIGGLICDREHKKILDSAEIIDFNFNKLIEQLGW